MAETQGVPESPYRRSTCVKESTSVQNDVIDRTRSGGRLFEGIPIHVRIVCEVDVHFDDEIVGGWIYQHMPFEYDVPMIGVLHEFARLPYELIVRNHTVTKRNFVDFVE